MFLDKLMNNNPSLVEYAFKAHREGLILPDTYLLDLDTIKDNGRKMVEIADKEGIKLYFMLKQIGRNPIIARELMNVGFDGAVVVDYKEALTMIDNDIHIGNVGHLVQTPVSALKKIIASKPDVVTVYSLDKIRQINKVAEELDMVQPLLIRVTDEDANLYSGQVGGFKSKELEEVINLIESLGNVNIGGLTVFPALLFNGDKKEIIPTDNMKGMYRAIEIMKNHGYENLQVNVPSASCCASLPLVKELGGNNAEPGHGITGTTPLHNVSDQPEKVGYVYVSEISHNYNDKSYCYGGGHYRRGHMSNVIVGTSMNDYVKSKVKAPDDDSIDYHYEIDGNFESGLSAIMCYRTQIFCTRSQVAVVKGIGTDPEIVGLYDSLGSKIERNW